MDLLERYRSRWKELDEFLAEVRECPFCGSSTAIPAVHDDDCPLRVVEPCGKLIPDSYGDGYFPCQYPSGHDGRCYLDDEDDD